MVANARFARVTMRHALVAAVLVAGGDAIVRLRPGQPPRTVVAGLGTITGLALAADGVLYAAGFDRREVLRIDRSGRVTTFMK